MAGEMLLPTARSDEQTLKLTEVHVEDWHRETTLTTDRRGADPSKGGAGNRQP